MDKGARMAKKQPVPQPYAKPDQIQIRGDKIYSILRQQWFALTPEERVRQEYLRVLIEEYGYKPEQIEEEVSVTGHGSGAARADFLIWRTPEAKQRQEHALIVIECKADNVTISLKDYAQGANYAQYEHARKKQISHQCTGPNCCHTREFSGCVCSHPSRSVTESRGGPWEENT